VSKIGGHAMLRGIGDRFTLFHISTFFSYRFPKAPHMRATGYTLIGALSSIGPKTERSGEKVIMQNGRYAIMPSRVSYLRHNIDELPHEVTRQV
jgi:hypothetical protein